MKKTNVNNMRETKLIWKVEHNIGVQDIRKRGR